MKREMFVDYLSLLFTPILIFISSHTGEFSDMPAVCLNCCLLLSSLPQPGPCQSPGQALCCRSPRYWFSRLLLWMVMYGTVSHTAPFIFFLQYVSQRYFMCPCFKKCFLSMNKNFIFYNYRTV